MNTDATINEEVDPQQEIRMLKEEVEELKKQLTLLKGVDVVLYNIIFGTWLLKCL